MLDKNIILVYEGEFTQEITKSVLSMAERNMESFGEDSSTKRKVFNVMVECLQNISRHSEKVHEDSVQKNDAIFMIGKQDDAYFITSGNPVQTTYVMELSDRLEHINSLDKDGLKELYKEVIKNGHISEKGGAGLGFIDMARKSGEKFQYDFEPINEQMSFFSLRTTIPRK